MVFASVTLHKTNNFTLTLFSFILMFTVLKHFMTHNRLRLIFLLLASLSSTVLKSCLIQKQLDEQNVQHLGDAHHVTYPHRRSV